MRDSPRRRRTMENSAQQVRQRRRRLRRSTATVPTGPVLLVDDIVDSRWTLTVVGRCSASPALVPCSLSRWPVRQDEPMSDHDRELAALLLVNRLSPRPAEPLKASEYWSLLDAVADPAVLLGLDGSRRRDRRASLDQPTADRIAALLDGATAFAIERERLEESGIRISRLSVELPQTVAEARRAPARLACTSPVAPALDEGGLGVVGSRERRREGAAVASLAAEHAVALGHQVISGLARGVDRDVDGRRPSVSVARSSAFRPKACGGSADGPMCANAVLDERLTLVSPYPPDAGFTAGNAMGRNKLIYALADVTLVRRVRRRPRRYVGRRGGSAPAGLRDRRRLDRTRSRTGQRAPRAQGRRSGRRRRGAVRRKRRRRPGRRRQGTLDLGERQPR